MLPSLIDETRSLLRDRGDLTLREIADATDVSLSWLGHFAGEGYSHLPRLDALERVRTFLLRRKATRLRARRARRV